MFDLLLNFHTLKIWNPKWKTLVRCSCVLDEANFWDTYRGTKLFSFQLEDKYPTHFVCLAFKQNAFQAEEKGIALYNIIHSQDTTKRNAIFIYHTLSSLVRSSGTMYLYIHHHTRNKLYIQLTEQTIHTFTISRKWREKEMLWIVTKERMALKQLYCIFSTGEFECVKNVH